MNKLLRSTVAAAVTAAVLTGCTVPGTNTRGGKSNEMTDSYSFTPNEAAESESVYSWLIQPSIQADNIISFDASRIDPDTADNKSYMNYSIVRQNGKYGLIDYAGNFIIKPAYDDYYVCSCGEVVLVNIIDERKKEYEYCTVDADKKISDKPKHTEDESKVYYWDIQSEKVFEGKRGTNVVTEYSSKKTVPVTEANVSLDDYGGYEVSVPDGAMCGLAQDGALITELIYDAYYAPSYKGLGTTLCAFRDTNGKWGYLDKDANVVIDFICDGDPNAYNGFLTDDQNLIHPYLFCDEYIPVYKDGYYSYYSYDGEQVVRAGEFAQARPINNGRAWVKQGDYWGVVQMGEIIEEEKPKEDSSSQASTTTANYWTDTTGLTDSQPDYTDVWTAQTDEFGNIVTTPTYDSQWTDPTYTDPVTNWFDPSTDTQPVDTEPVYTEPVYTDPVDTGEIPGGFYDY